uniref:p21-C-terminal region-binding protein, putative n=1 Tax=Theileria annulata TaxID=5874 RepID=A0A3B0MTL0_THEAN
MSDSDSDVDAKVKRRKTESSDDDSSYGDVEAEFLFNDPCSDDLDGIFTLLQGKIKSLDWNLPKSVNKDLYLYLSELVSNQPNIGTLIKVEDEEDSYVMAVLSLLNIKQYEGLDSLVEAVLKKAESHCDKNDLKSLRDVLLDEKNQVGLLINERMGNVPSQLLGKLQECVKEDIKWSKENSEDEDEKKFYNFTHILGLSRLYSQSPSDKSKYDNLVYQKPEEKYYYDNSFVRFMWPTGESNTVKFYEDDNNKKPTSKVLQEYMFAYCLKFDRYNFVVKEIAKNFRE